jgi:hypothetical protein
MNLMNPKILTMKISIEQANKLLYAILENVAVADDELDADVDVDTEALTQAIHKKVAADITPILEEQLKPALESHALARVTGTVKSAACRILGITKKHVEDLNFEQLFTRFKASVEANQSSTEGDKQVRMETAIHGYETQLEQLKEHYEALLTEERNKHAQRDITARCIAIMEKLPRKGGDLHEQAEMLRYKMQSAYDVQYNPDTKRLEFYKDGNPALADNNQPVSDEDYARNWADKTGILVHDTRHISPADVKTGQQGMYGTGIVHLSNEEATNNGMDAIVAWASV